MTVGSQVVTFALDPTEIAAGDLQLRVWDPSMVDAVLEAVADPEIRRWNPLRVADPVTDEELAGDALARAWIENRREWAEHATWAVCDATTGTVLGYVSLHDLQRRHLTGEVGYWVLAGARGRGVGRGAVSAACGYGFGALGLNRIELFHAVDNLSSCGVATGAGFALEGIAREAYRYGDDVLHDDHMHARLAADSPPA
jgi:RimJ/RimL family protein N-acetyltransferase